MDKVRMLAAAKSELLRHSWGTFVDNPPSVAQGQDAVARGLQSTRRLD